MSLRRSFIIAVGLGLVSANGYALATDPLIEGAKLCTRFIPQFEREYGIPTHLLSAIASTESGRYHNGLGIKVPWPWTINAEGKGYVFDSKYEAIAAVNKLRAQGVKSIDVGCMQVNLHHHPTAFASLEQAFDPQYNIAYAAGFLRNLYEEQQSWRTAATFYHSRTPTFGAKYVGRVYDHWHKILDKLRQAKMQVPESSLAALKESPMLQVEKTQKHVRVAENMPPAYQPIRMKTIQLSKKNTQQRDKGVLVIRPEQTASAIPVAYEPEIPEPAPVLTLAELKPASAMAVETREVATPSVPVMKTVQAPAAMRSTPADNNSRKTGPTFIFTD